MKKLFVLCVLLSLASCIQVDDFGDYWDKASVDPSLEGQWQIVSDEDDGKVAGQYATFTLKNGAYEVTTTAHSQTDANSPIYPVKTIAVGPYRFLANGPEKGTIQRYSITGDVSTWYTLNPAAAWAFIQKNYPDQQSFYRGDPDDPNEPDLPPDEPVKINIFNNEVATILSAIPDNQVYWDPDTTLKKVK